MSSSQDGGATWYAASFVFSRLLKTSAARMPHFGVPPETRSSRFRVSTARPPCGDTPWQWIRCNGSLTEGEPCCPVCKARQGATGPARAA
eukprot:scaffold570_cov234-Pinguiococcus_pyrenoidosus.AAC.2